MPFGRLTAPANRGYGPRMLALMLSVLALSQLVKDQPAVTFYEQQVSSRPVDYCALERAANDAAGDLHTAARNGELFQADHFYDLSPDERQFVEARAADFDTLARDYATECAS